MKPSSKISPVLAFGTVILVSFLAGIGFTSFKNNPLEYYPVSLQVPEKEGLFISNIAPYQKVASPLTIEGYANGNGWVPFEAVLGTVTLVDDKNNTLAYSIINSYSETMEFPFAFSATLEFEEPISSKGYLIFKNDNPSGLPENEREYKFPVTFSEYGSPQTAVLLYFGNSDLDPETTCVAVFPVERKITKTSRIAMATLEALIAGLTEEEKSQNYFTSVNSGVKVKSVSIKDGVAKADFDEKLEFQVGGSCKVAAIRAQIEKTLLQFPTISSVVISINGRTEDILQP